MNKNKELFDIEMNNGIVFNIFNQRKENQHLLPVFLSQQEIQIDSVNSWWAGRRIPASRVGIKELFWQLNDISLDFLAEKSLGLSLSDHYWIRPTEEIKWEDVNFFQNTFSEDIGQLLITGDWNGGDLHSPDNTSDGVLRKRWKIIDGKRCLIKGSTSSLMQTQTFREVFAGKIAELLFKPFESEIEFVTPYWLINDKDIYYSVCPSFITTDTEYVSFNQINRAYTRQTGQTQFTFCRDFYKDFEYVLDLTLILDYIILNEDRHFGNFGMIRDTNNGEWKYPAPVFDSGSSLFFETREIDIVLLNSKPFNKKFDRQIQEVQTEIYMDPILLVKKYIEELYWDSFKNAQEDKERLERIFKVCEKQIENLIMEQKPHFSL
jgi:hypothetical protein